jgi:hypothetical protein
LAASSTAVVEAEAVAVVVAVAFIRALGQAAATFPVDAHNACSA